MAESDSITDICDSDFESDFVNPHVLKSFDVDIDQVTSIAFTYFDQIRVALISTNNSTCRNLYCEKSGDKTPFLIQRINGYCSNGNPRFESADIVFAEKLNIYGILLCEFTQKRDDIQYGFSIPVYTSGVAFLNNGFAVNLSITGVCSTNEQDVAACIVESHSYVLTKNSCRKITIFDRKHFHKPKISYDKFTPSNSWVSVPLSNRDIEFDGQKRLFNYPRRIALSSRGDFWVVNRTGEQSGDVTVVGMADGKLKFRYNRRVGSIPFDPKDVSKNIKETMVIADFGNHAIHLVKDDGTFLQYIMTSVHGLSFPTTVVLDGYDRAWVGCDFGKVHIVRFNKGFE